MKKTYRRYTKDFMEYLEKLMAPIPELDIPVELPTIREGIALRSQLKKLHKKERREKA